MVRLYDRIAQEHHVEKLVAVWNPWEQRHGYVFVHFPDCRGCAEAMVRARRN